MSKLALYKSHYSMGGCSILTLDKPQGIDKYPTSILDLVIHSKQSSFCLVEDQITGFLEILKNSIDNKLKMIFGLRIEVTKDILNQDEKSLKNRAKYIIFIKNNEGYKDLIKISSFAAKDGFYYNGCIDFKNLKRLWSENLILAVPFYDSFIHLNTLKGHFHVPEFEFTRPVFFLEENELPFDDLLRAKVLSYCKERGFETIEAQSIYYKSKEDFIAFLTFKCIANRTTVEKPEFPHLCSDTFCYERWLKNENNS